MEPNESNPLKSQPTGGLKLMTVFIAVLALHVLVIGGFTVWHLLYPANADSDLALDKSHKAKIMSDSSIGDVSTADAASADKAAATPPPASTDNNSTDTPATPDASATASTAPATPATPASTASSVITVPASPTMPATPTMAEDTSAAASNPPVTAQTPSGPVYKGPVVNPPDNLAPPGEAAAGSSVATDATTPATPVAGVAYTVKRGDSLAKIAHRHHIALAKLRAANSLTSDSLHLGQKLVIPARDAKTADASEALASSAAPAIAAPAASASTAPLAQPVQESDNVTMPAANTSLAGALPKHTHKALAAHHLYTVVKGDTLTKIARRYHTTTSAIMAANNLTNAGRLSIGQKLHIPPHPSREAATAEEAAPQEPQPHSTTSGQLANYLP
jgi:LysM repeat protein